MKILYWIILVSVTLLILSGVALGVTYPINSTILQPNITNATIEPIETVVETVVTAIEPTETVVEPVVTAIEPTDVKPKTPKETPKSPGFEIILAIGILSITYIFRKRI